MQAKRINVRFFVSQLSIFLPDAIDDGKYCLIPLKTRQLDISNDTLATYVAESGAPQRPHKHRPKPTTHSEAVGP